jgi:RNA polymerase sigma factor (sigma-70 family)
MARPLPLTLARIIGEITTAFRRDVDAGPTLLAQYVATRDEDAFRELVRFYAPIVWGVCQRWLRDSNDAEDALQATFIVLARNASRVSPPERLSAWLHGVAVRVAKRVRDQSAHRRKVQGAALPESAATSDPSSPEIREILDEELLSLPEQLRQAFVLCRMEGWTYAEAAGLLGCPLRTVGNRVSKATELLRQRLGRRGLAPAGALTGVMSPALGAVPTSVLDRTVSCALGGPSATAAAVADSVIRGMAGVGLWRYLALGVLMFAGVGGVLVAQGSVPRTVRQPASAIRAVPAPADPLPDGAVGRIRTGRKDQLAFALSPDNRTVYTVDGSDKIRVWEATTGKDVREIAGPEHCQWVTVPPDGRRLIAGGESGVWFWALEGNGQRELARLPLPKGSIRCEACAPDGHALMLSGLDGEVYVSLPDLNAEALAKFSGTWDRTIARTEASQKNPGIRPPAGRAQVAFSPDSRMAGRVRSAGPVRELVAWVPQTSKLLSTVKLGNDSYPTFAIAPGIRQLLAVAAEFPEGPGREKVSQLRGYDRETGSLLWEAPLPKGSPGSIAFSPDGRSLAVGCADGTVRVFETFSAEERFRRSGHRGAVLALSFSVDGRMLISGDTDGTILVWRTRPDGVPPADTTPEALWVALMSGTDCPAAYRAMHALVDRPAVAVPLLQVRLKKMGHKPFYGMLRGVEVLERLADDPEARKLLTRLAATPAGSPLGDEARDALQRLEGKAPAVP